MQMLKQTQGMRWKLITKASCATNDTYQASAKIWKTLML